MSDPATGSAVATALTGATIFGIATQTDYGVVFGAFAGAVYYVATAADVPLMRRGCYFLTSFITGVLGADFAGDRITAMTGYEKQALAPLAAVLVSAMAIKTLAWLNSQSISGWLSRFRGGGAGNG
ncbi:putative holin [Dickeya zeae]|uniref:putative holin n=1 Tax=Dickeya zeae TaxID=204042 RepID=UPI001C635D89|nr:putative holin [Dickeya zeae]